MSLTSYLTRTSTSAIGLDVGSHAVKAVQFTSRGEVQTLAHAASIPRTADGGGGALDQRETLRIMEALWRQGFSGTRLVLGIPGSMLLTSVMELPPKSSAAPLAQIAQAELARAHKCLPTELEIAWWELPGGVRAAEGTHALAVGCRHTDANALMDLFVSAGAEVVALDASMLALVRACQTRLAPAPELTAILDLGWQAASLLIIAAGAIVYERSIRELGLLHMMDKVAKTFGIDAEAAAFLVSRIGCGDVSPQRPLSTLDQTNDTHIMREDSPEEFDRADDLRAVCIAHADAVAAELRLSAGYSSRRFGHGLSSALLTGGMSVVPALIERISTSSEISCLRMHPGDVFSLAPAAARVCFEAPMLVAMGLAQHPAGNTTSKLQAEREVAA